MEEGEQRDGSFFKFLLGFAGIIFVSFGITYAVGMYTDARAAQGAAAAQAILNMY